MTKDMDLLQEYSSHSEPRLRGNALAALVAMGTPAALAAFADAVEKESDPEVLRRAIKSVEAINVAQAERLAAGLPARLDDPQVGPSIYNLLARVRAMYPDLVIQSDWPVWRRLLQAWRTRRLPATLAPRGFQFRSARMALVSGFLLAAILAIVIRPSVEAEVLWPVVGLGIYAGLLAGGGVLATTRRFYGTRFHLYRFSGALVEAARTVIAGSLVVGLIAYIGGLLVDAGDLAALVWSLVLAVLFLAAARLGVALGSGRSRPLAIRLPRWPRFTATFCGAFFAGFVVTVVCALVARTAASEELSQAAAVWWLVFTPAAVALSWRLSLQEPGWAPALRWRALHRALLIACLVAGLVPLAVVARFGSGAVWSRLAPAVELPTSEESPTVTRDVGPLGASIPFRVGALSEVEIEAVPREGVNAGLQIGARGGLVELRDIDRLRAGSRTFVDLFAEGTYEAEMMPRGRTGNVVDTVHRRLRGLLGGAGGTAGEAAENLGHLVLAGRAIEARSERWSLGENQLQPRRRYYLVADRKAREKAESVTFGLDLQVDRALVDLKGRAVLSASGAPALQGHTLTLWRADREENLGEAEDLEMRRILQKGEHRVTLTSAELALEIEAQLLTSIEGPETARVGRLEAGPGRCWVGRTLPMRIAFETSEAGALEVEAFDWGKRNIALELRSLPDEGRLGRSNAEGASRDLERVVVADQPAGRFLAEANLGVGRPPEETEDTVICVTAVSPTAS